MTHMLRDTAMCKVVCSTSCCSFFTLAFLVPIQSCCSATTPSCIGPCIRPCTLVCPSLACPIHHASNPHLRLFMFDQVLQVLEAVLHDEGEGDWSPTLRHQASLHFPDTIDPAVSVTVPIANRTCIVCSEEVVNDQAVHFISGCSHIMCVSCSIGYVRCTMDVATPDLYPFR